MVQPESSFADGVRGRKSRSRDIRDEGCRRVARRPRSLLGPHWRTQDPYTQIGKTLVGIRSEDAVTIVDDEAVGMVARQRFPKLLQRPSNIGRLLVQQCARAGRP